MDVKEYNIVVKTP